MQQRSKPLGLHGETTMSLVGAPDWRLVHFDVACARCGCNLRDHDEPRCPTCGFEFDWSEAVPLEELTCPTCGYHLCGLNDPRCPECGNAFTWDGVLEWYRRARSMLFEHHWRDRPVRSFLVSFARSVRPKRFWAELNIHDPVPVRPLLAMTMIAAMLSACVGLIVFVVSFWLWFSIRRVNWVEAFQFSSLVRFLISALEDRGFREAVFVNVLWCFLCIFALLIFQQSMRRCRVRTGHVIRVWAYAVTRGLLSIPLTLLLFCALRPLVTSVYVIEALAILVVGCVVVANAGHAIFRGYRDYLKMDHSLAVAISSQLMAVPATLLLWLYGFHIR